MEWLPQLFAISMKLARCCRGMRARLLYALLHVLPWQLACAAPPLSDDPLSRFRAVIQDRLAGRWLYFLGDSSLRGLNIALIQQLTWQDARHVVMAATDAPDRARNWSSAPWITRGWFDVVLGEQSDGSWAQLAATESAHDCPRRLGGLPKCRPGVERSRELAAAWCGAKDRDARGVARTLRLTYRQLTYLRYVEPALAEDEAAWESSACQHHRGARAAAGPEAWPHAAVGPDAILLQGGFWDLKHSTPALAQHALLLRALRALRSRSQRNGAARRAAFASLPMPWPGRDDSVGQWQRSVVEEASADASDGPLASAAPQTGPRGPRLGLPKLGFFERVVNASSVLSDACQAGCGLPAHPPHAINVPLLPRMLEAWVGRGGRGHEPLLQEGASCCCGIPGDDARLDVPSPNGPRGASATSFRRVGTLYWAAMCPLQTWQPLRAATHDGLNDSLMPLLRPSPPPPLADEGVGAREAGEVGAAFCVAGQARGFAQRRVWQGIRTNAVGGFGAAADVFLVLRYGDGETRGASSDPELARTLSAARLLRPTRFELLPDALPVSALNASWASFNASIGGRATNVCPLRRSDGTPTYRYRFLSAWTTLGRSFEMVLEEEAKRGARYSFVVRLRPDEQICRPFPPWQKFVARYRDRTIATPGKGPRHRPNMDDHIFVAARHLADHIFAARHEVGLCKPAKEYRPCRQGPYIAPPDVPAECLLISWLQRGKIVADTFSAPILSAPGAGQLNVMWDNSTWRRTRHPDRPALGPVLCHGDRAADTE